MVEKPRSGGGVLRVETSGEALYTLFGMVSFKINLDLFIREGWNV